MIPTSEDVDVTATLEYCRRFFGYGNPRADWWFVGLEEGGEPNIKRRVEIWKAHDRPPIDDLVKVHEELGDSDWFGIEAKVQKTWGMLVRAILRAKGQEATSASILGYQREQLGRSDRQTVLLELMPLPAMKLSHWPYGALGIQALRPRREYRRTFRQDRVRALKQLISDHEPPAVVFYGGRAQWPALLGLERKTSNDDYDLATAGASHFLITDHPGKWGPSSDARF